MITYVKGSIFDSPMQTLVCPVNVVGVISPGIMTEFARRYPMARDEYWAMCEFHHLTFGLIALHKDNPDGKWILSFPVQRNWRRPAHLEWIELSLQKFVKQYKELGIVSAAFPAYRYQQRGDLWNQQAIGLYNFYLSTLPIGIEIYT